MCYEKVKTSRESEVNPLAADRRGLFEWPLKVFFVSSTKLKIQKAMGNKCDNLTLDFFFHFNCIYTYVK